MQRLNLRSGVAAFLVSAAALVIVARRQDPALARESVPSPAYRAYAEAEIRNRFRREVHRAITDAELADALAWFDDRARELPGEVARELISREHRNLEARADLESRGALGLAENLAGGGAGPLEDLVSTRESIDALFERLHAERRVALARPSEILGKLAPGVTLALPEGVFELANVLAEAAPFPSDVTLTGASALSTLIVLKEPLDARGPLERFTLRDCTLFAPSGRVFSQPAGAAVVRLLGVRVVGFDQGADCSGLLRFGAALVLDARDCRFQGGFGSVPGSGALFDVPRDALLARVEDCELDLLCARISRHPRGTTLRFVGCRFERVVDDPLADVERRRGILLEECDVRRLEDQPPARRALDELFPKWRERMRR